MELTPRVFRARYSSKPTTGVRTVVIIAKKPFLGYLITMIGAVSQNLDPIRLPKYEPNLRLRCFDTVSSTNDVARGYALAGEEEGLVILAETQTRGKGRWGRTWQSPRGGLWFTILLRPSSLERLGLTSLAAGVSVVNTIKSFGAVSDLKWPNDIMSNSRKLGGILVEGGTQGDSNYALVGIGINLNVSRDAFSEDIRETAVSVLELTSRTISRDIFIDTLLGHFYKRYQSIVCDQTDSILGEYKLICSSLGRKVRVRTSEETIDGIVIDIAHDGALILDTGKGTTRNILYGEVTSLREKTGTLA